MKELNSLALKVRNNKLYILDQELLPQKEEWICCQGPQHMVQIIKQLKVRGAPLIGVSAAISLALYAQENVSSEQILTAYNELASARPTAVNLCFLLDELLTSAIDKDSQQYDPTKLIKKAEELFTEDCVRCERLAMFGSDLIPENSKLITHCNTGGLATAGIGTALGVIVYAAKLGKKPFVYVDETRPLLQGGRLTAWELKKADVFFNIICDSAAGAVMKREKIAAVFVGADRIAANGDTANKIGTYSLAVNANFHQVPFYVIAPMTTIDLSCPTGAQIPIEQRNSNEILGVNGAFGRITWAPIEAQAFNPAFDVTPVELITGIVTDKGYYTRQEITNNALARNY